MSSLVKIVFGVLFLGLSLQAAVVEVSVSRDSQPVAGQRIYAFSASGDYLNIYANTNEVGVAEFDLDLSQAVKFRTSAYGATIWSSETQVAGAFSFVLDSISEVTLSRGGEPLSNWRVYLYDGAGAYLGYYRTTDENGVVKFSIPTGDAVQFRADNLGQQNFTDVVTAPGDVAFDLPAETTVTLTKGGELLPNHRVYLYDGSGAYLGYYRTTDGNGAVDFSIPVGDSVQFRADNLGQQNFTDVVTAPGEVSFDLPAETPVTLSKGGELLLNHRVYLYDGSGDYLGYYRTTDENGVVEFSIPTGDAVQFRADNLGQQNFTDVVTAPGDVAFDLPAETTVTLTKDGEPLSNRRVYLYNDVGAYLGYYRTTDENGMIEFSIPVGDAVQFRADDLGQKIFTDVVTAPGDVTLDLPAETTVTLTKDGEPLSNHRVYLYDGAGTYLGYYRTTDENGVVVFSISTGDAVQFRADDLGQNYFTDVVTAPGEVSFDLPAETPVTLSKGGELLLNHRVYLYDGSGDYLGYYRTTDENGVVEFSIPVGDAVQFRADDLGQNYFSDVETAPGEVTLDLPAETIVTLTKDGDPHPDRRVYLYDGAGDYLGYYRTTDENGVVAFSIPTGDAVQFRADDLGQKIFTDVITAPGEVALDLPAETIVTLTKDGQPLSNHRVYLYDGAGTYLGYYRTTDENGVVAFSIPTGDAVQFRADDLGQKIFSEVVTAPADATLDLPAETTVTLTKDGEPLFNHRVYLYDGAGDYLGYYRTTNESGVVKFSIPTGDSIQFRSDDSGEQIYSEVVTAPSDLAFELIPDDTPPPADPVIIIEAPVDFDSPVNVTEIVMAGTVTASAPLSSFTINDEPANVEVDGSFTATVALPDEGVNTVILLANDSDGRSTTLTKTLIRDTLAPALTVDAPVNGRLTNRDSIVVRGTVASSAQSLTVNGGDVAIAENGTFAHTLDLPSEGEVSIAVMATDAAGNATTVSRSITVDRTPPTWIELSHGADGDFLVNITPIVLTGRLVGAGVSMSINGTPTSLDQDGNFSQEIALIESENTIELTATDAAGNQATRLLSGVLDTVAPLVQIDQPVAGAVSATPTTTVSGSVDDASAILSLNGEPLTHTDGQFSADVPLEQPENTIIVRAEDAAGNTSEATVTVLLDQDAPTVILDQPAPSSRLTRHPLLNLQGRVDEASAVVSINGQPATVADGIFSLAGFSLQEGVNVLTVSATDSAGNEADPVVIEVVLDTTAPTPPVLQTPPAFVDADRVTLTIQTEPDASVEISGGLIQRIESADQSGLLSVEVLLNPNTKTDLILHATDTAGNRSQPTVHTIVSDTTPPVIILDSPVESDSLERPFAIVSGQIQDTNAPGEIIVNGVTVPLAANGRFAHSLALSGESPAAVTVSAADAAGNAAQVTRLVAFSEDGIDTEAPQIAVVSPEYDAVVPSATITVEALIIDESELLSITVDGIDRTAEVIAANGWLSYTFTVDASGEFTIVATDTENQTTTRTHRVQIDGDAPNEPVIRVVSPESPTTSAEVLIHATAKPGLQYELTGGLTTPINGTVDASGKINVVVPLNPNADNLLELRVVAANGLPSAPATATVRHDTVAPEVRTASVPGAAPGSVIGSDSEFAIEFSEAMATGGFLSVALLAGDQPVDYTPTLSPDGKTFTLSPVNPLPLSSRITVNIPPLADLAGNLMSDAFTVSFDTLDDSAPLAPVFDPYPAIIRSQEIILSGSAEADATLTLTGGEADVSTIVNPNAAGPATRLSSPKSEGEPASPVGGTFSVTVALLPNTANALTATLSDAAGNTSDSVSLNLTHDSIAPVLTGSTPASGAADVATDTTITLTFNETIDSASAESIALVAPGLVPATVTVVGEIVTLSPDEPLLAGRAYEVVIPASLSDLAGNTIGASTRLTLTTSDAGQVAAPIIYDAYPEEITNANSITVEGFSTPGSTLNISGGQAPFTYPPTGVIDNTGEFTVQVPLTTNASNNIIFEAEDADGNRSPATEAIRVEQDATAPTVAEVVPTGSDVAIASTVSITFSEAIRLDGLSASPPALRLLDGLNRPVSGSWFPSSDKRVITFYPSVQLDPQTNYTVVVDTNLRDLAGNAIAASETFTFTTAAGEADIGLLPAPILDPLGFANTTAPTITVGGSAEPNTTLYILGARIEVTATVGSDGRFTVDVPLITDATNRLVAYVEDDAGTAGLTATLSLTQSSRSTGIRILSPQPDLEYNNRSVMITGMLDNPVEFERVLMATEANGSLVEEETATFGPYFARQFIREPYAVSLTTGALPVSGSRQLAIRDDAGSLQFRFFDSSGAIVDYLEADLMDMTAELADFKSQLQPLWNTEVSDPAVTRGIEAAACRITAHSIDEGEQTVTIRGELLDGSWIEESITYTLFIQPEGADTRAPIVTFLYPEPGEVIAEDIVETFLVVEEGVRLSDVEIGGVVAHNMLGNFFFIYAVPEAQGSNTLTARAKDYAGNSGIDEVEVIFDTEPAADPVIDPVVSFLPERDVPVVSGRVLTLGGTGEAGSIILVENGLTPVRAVVATDGTWSVKVPLNANSTNQLAVFASDAAGNLTEAQIVSVVHDDTAPYPTGSAPASGQTGVAPDTAITVTFSEPLDPDSVDTSTVSLSRINPAINAGALTAVPAYNVILAADGRSIEILPDFKFNRGETIVVGLADSIRDVNTYTMESAYELRFETALYQTTLSGVVVDPAIRALRNVKVGILGSDAWLYTSSFGTFVLDEVPLGEQILYVDARPDAATGAPPQGDDRVFNYLEFPVFIEEDTDNSLARPIFMVDTDFSSAIRVTSLDGANALAFASDRSDLAGFEILYEGGTARFADGTDRGEITATRIDPAHIPDRLPDGSIPHFMVEIGPDDLSFSTSAESPAGGQPATPVGAALRFPNAYELSEGDEVIVFHFKHGLEDYKELARVILPADLSIETDPVLTESGFVGILPVGGDADFSRAYIEGRVVDGNGTGIEGVSVNAIAGTTYVLTDAEGFYRIPMPEVRIFQIQTFATISTRSAGSDADTPDLVYPSELIELAVSGTTTVPDIVIDTFILEGSIRYFDDAGARLGLTGYGVNTEGRLNSIDPADARAVDIFIYRRIGEVDGLPVYDSAPYMRAVTDLPDLLDDTYDASFSTTFFGSLAEADESDNSPAPKPGDVVKVVAFDSRTGFYAESDLEIPAPTAGAASPAEGEPTTSVGGTAANRLRVDLDLQAPRLELEANRVFFIDGVRRRANIPHQGIVFTDDEFVEFKTSWRTADAIPLNRPELSLAARLRVDSIDYKTDYNFRIQGGEQFRVLELREAFYPSRLQVLQRETDVGRERFSVSRNGSFRANSLVPVTVNVDQYGLAQSQASEAAAASIRQEVVFDILDFAIDASGEQTRIAGRTLPGGTVTVGGHSLTAGPDGFFGTVLDQTVGEGGIEVDTGNGFPTRYGASFTPVITALDPQRGSQGDTVVITGEYFSPQAAENKVAFNGAPAEILSASETELTVRVPDEASSGDVTVTLAGKVSNGVRFEFISLGINNGSFESGWFRGFSRSGSAEVVKSQVEIDPSNGAYMAMLSTAQDSVAGVSTITSDPFIVSDFMSGESFFVFDYYIAGTAVFAPLDSYVSISVIKATGEMLEVVDALPSITSHNSFRMIGYNQGSGFRTASIDLSGMGVGLNDEIQIRISLRGRGRLPAFIPGSRLDDQNPIDSAKLQGTALLLDNLRLTGAPVTSVPVSVEGAFSADGGQIEMLVSSNIPTDARVYVASLASGFTRSFDRNDIGAYDIQLDSMNFAQSGRASLLVWYQTIPVSGSDRVHSNPVYLRISQD